MDKHNSADTSATAQRAVASGPLVRREFTSKCGWCDGGKLHTEDGECPFCDNGEIVVTPELMPDFDRGQTISDIAADDARFEPNVASEQRRGNGSNHE